LNQNEDNKTLSDRNNSRIFSEAVLQIVRLSNHTYHDSYNTNHEILKQICFERATRIAGYGKIEMS
jgi:hypothetical protein